jgi:CRISPR-associated endoribonuclease Cas6
MEYLLPDPEKIFSSLLRLWNLAAEEMVVEPIGDYRQWVQREVYVSRHRIRTSTADLGQRRSVIGFVGDATFGIRKDDSTFAPLTRVLAKFSELTNIGKNRTAGFGKVQARVVSPG